MEKRKIGILVGSLRKKAFSRSVANLIMEIAPSSFDMKQLQS